MDIPLLKREDFLEGRFGVVVMAEQEEAASHQHDFLELTYIMKGRIEHEIDGRRQILREGNYFIVDYHTAHQYRPCRGEVCRLINFLFTPSFIDPALAKCQSFEPILRSYFVRFGNGGQFIHPENHIFEDRDGVVSALAERMQQEFEARERGYQEVIRCCLIEIIIMTMRKMNLPALGEAITLCGQMAEYIDEHYMEPVTLRKLGERLHYSTPYLSQKFKQVFGMTFRQYLQKVRIEQSCRLLSDTDGRISSIAQAVGYEDFKFFQAVFKRQMHMTPREFRRFVHAGKAAASWNL